MKNFQIYLFMSFFVICFIQINAIPKFEVSKNSILKLIPAWLTPLTTNDQNLKLGIVLLNCSYTVRNINQCGSNFIDETILILTPLQKNRVINAATKYLLRVGPTAKIHIDLLYNIIYDEIKTPIWDKSQNLAKKYKKYDNFRIYAADMINKAFNKKFICKIAINVKTKFGMNAWQAVRDYFGDIAIIISKCAL
uniref:Uncharacterized protein n=1 Tax=Panagrolaimus sp. PS1159 TaxID=55785 RepID=A0AC35F1K2_9BILA